MTIDLNQSLNENELNEISKNKYFETLRSFNTVLDFKREGYLKRIKTINKLHHSAKSFSELKDIKLKFKKCVSAGFELKKIISGEVEERPEIINLYKNVNSL